MSERERSFHSGHKNALFTHCRREFQTESRERGGDMFRLGGGLLHPYPSKWEARALWTPYCDLGACARTAKGKIQFLGRSQAILSREARYPMASTDALGSVFVTENAGAKALRESGRKEKQGGVGVRTVELGFPPMVWDGRRMPSLCPTHLSRRR